MERFISFNTEPLVSVVISIYNGSAHLNRCLQSVINQTYQNLEIVCIDDASTDNTPKMLKQWQKKYPPIIRCLTNTQNIGLTKSLNKGIEITKGQYIARLDADDWWEPNKLSKQISWLTNHPDHGLLGSCYTNHYSNHKRNVFVPLSNREIKKHIFKQNPFGHSCVIVKKTLLDKSSKYDEKIRYGQDRDLWFRLLPLTQMANLEDVLCHRTIQSNTNKRQQVIQQIATTTKYLKKYQAPVKYYLYLIQPISLLLVPNRLRILFRKYGYLFTN
ncbi:MAG: glycosyltransferase family 2 protein [bacterium]|nr:glycosyltransferase family 2 protein [bacterium]